MALGALIMSYAFDVMSRVFAEHIEGMIESELAFRFRMLFEEMHEANHRLNDAINKDGRVSRAARELDEFARD